MASIDIQYRDEQLVVFKLGSESFGIEIFRVNEIIRLSEVTSIPQSEEFMLGIVNLRGHSIPVMDLRKRLSTESNDERDEERIVIVNRGSGMIGLVVDSVREVITIPANLIARSPIVNPGTEDECVRGIVNHSSGLITLLNLDSLIAA